MSQKEEEKVELINVEEEKVDKFLEFLNEKWTEQKQCPICGKNNWVLGSYITRNDPLRPRVTKVLGTYCYAHVACDFCGYTLFFNAVTAGIEKKRSSAKTEDSSDE